jgi:hypothetical protein
VVLQPSIIPRVTNRTEKTPGFFIARIIRYISRRRLVEKVRFTTAARPGAVLPCIDVANFWLEREENK